MLARLSAGERLTALVWTTAAAAGLVLAVAAASILAVPGRIDGVFLLVVLATLCTDALSLDLRVGRHIESYTWAELTVVLALALLSPAPLVLTALAVAAAHIATRRSPIKVVFNTASYAIGITLAAIVTHVITTPSWDDPMRSAIALVLGAAAFSVWNAVSVDAAIAFSQDMPFREVYRKGLPLRVAVCCGNILIALLLLALVRTEPLALLAIPACLVAAYVAYRACLRAIQERAVWRHIEATSREINRLDERAVAEIAVARAASLFEADAVELALYSWGATDTARVYEGDARGVTAIRQEMRADFTCGTSTELVEGTSVVPVELHGRYGPIGVLCVSFYDRVKFTERENQLLRTYAHTISTSIENARLYQEMVEHAARSEKAAMHDSLTGLPNRVLLEERVTALLDAGDACDFALMLMDLDHFKDVNDGLGHTFGDAVLREIAARLRRSSRPQDVVCRLGGDEFAILVHDGSAAVTVAERLAAVVAQPMEINGMRLSVGGSIGFACHPDDGVIFEELLQHADVAMYQAKACRGSLRRYRSGRNTSTSAATKEKLSLVAELRSALDDDQFELHYQPQVDLTTGKPVAAEALVRWRHPARGLLQPHSFIGLIESSSLIRPFTCAVLDRAVAECAQWQRPGRPLSVSVNLSARNLDDERLADDVVAVLRRHRLPASCLVLEITETAILGDLDFVEEQMARLASIGVSLSIDDFGTGSSSLTFLQRVMVHELKIDRSFVAGIVRNENDAAITRATVKLAQSLGLRTVAEGVEHPLVAQELIDLECDSAQGFLWSRPVPAPAIRRVLGLGPELTVVTGNDEVVAAL